MCLALQKQWLLALRRLWFEHEGKHNVETIYDSKKATETYRLHQAQSSKGQSDGNQKSRVNIRTMPLCPEHAQADSE